MAKKATKPKSPAATPEMATPDLGFTESQKLALAVLAEVSPPVNFSPDLFLREHRQKLAGVTPHNFRMACIAFQKQRQATEKKAQPEA